MQRVTIDIESFWSKTHSLSKMNPLDYVMHPDTELISCSRKVGRGRTKVVFGEREIRAMLADVDWSDTLAIAHNMAGFDALIMAWRLGISPKMWGCTLSMARPIHAKTIGLSLARLVQHYGLGEKNGAILVKTQGKHLADFTEGDLAEMRVYNAEDTDQCHALFDCLAPHYSAKELWHIDATIRTLVEPEFVVNRGILEGALVAEQDQKRNAVLRLARFMRANPAQYPTVGAATSMDGIEEAVRVELASTPKFKALLESQDVEVPMKPSPKDPKRLIPALAKTDQVFLDMQEDDNPMVAAAARARLAVKSTILETRIGAFLNAADVCDGLLPIPLHYCGADTTGRDSGWLYNPQNLPAVRGEPTPAHALRMSMEAPPGYVVAVADLSGIELRVNHFLWKVKSTMDLYRDDPQADLYRAAASLAIGCTPEEVSKLQRQLEKTKQLGLGFGAGAVTFRRVARTKAMGGIIMTLEEAQGHVDAWRAMYAEIHIGWRTCGSALQDIYARGHRAIDPWGMCETHAEGIVLPSGRMIRYPNLRQGDDGTWPDGRERTGWFYGDGRHKARLTGPKVDENIVQALARDILFDNAYQFYRDTGFRAKLRVHDELVFLFPESEAEALLAHLQVLMRTAPTWWPELITWSEGDLASAYGLAK